MFIVEAQGYESFIVEAQGYESFIGPEFQSPLCSAGPICRLPSLTS